MWWSHDSSREEPHPHNTPLVKRKGGIALAVNDSFLKLFKTSKWVVASKGRAAVLQLRGDLGALDVWCIYLHASDPKARIDTLRTIGRMVRPQEYVSLCPRWGLELHHACA